MTTHGTPEQQRRRRTRSIRISRDTILFVAGLAGIGYETVWDNADRPTLLILFSAMVGLPAFLGKDEKNKDKEKDNKESDDTAVEKPAAEEAGPDTS